MQNPFCADLYLTHYCNLCCSFCCYRPFQGGANKDLSTEQWFKIIEQLAALKVFRVNILAGEPLLRQDLLTILWYIAKCNMRFALNTNGTLLTDEFAQSLAEIRRTDEVQISIDGMENFHDAIRGKGNWRRAVTAVNLLKKYHVPVVINMVLTNANYSECSHASEFFLNELHVDTLRISSVTDSFNELDASQGRLSDEQYVRAMLEVVKLKAVYSNIRSGFIEMYNEITNPVIKKEGGRCCNTPWKHISICADGRVIGCPNAVDYVIGDSLQTPLYDLWHNNQKLDDFRAETSSYTKLPEQCNECHYIWYCRQCCPPSRNKISRCRKRLAEIMESMQ